MTEAVTDASHAAIVDALPAAPHSRLRLPGQAIVGSTSSTMVSVNEPEQVSQSLAHSIVTLIDDSFPSV